jgi:hypothetical protein
MSTVLEGSIGFQFWHLPAAVQEILQLSIVAANPANIQTSNVLNAIL